MLKDLNVIHGAARLDVAPAPAHAERPGPCAAAAPGASLRWDGISEGRGPCPDMSDGSPGCGSGRGQPDQETSESHGG